MGGTVVDGATQPPATTVGASVVLGISGGFHDAAACLVVDGEIVAALEQERLSRVRHDPEFPFDAALSCLAIAGIDAGDVDVVAINEKPILVLQRYLATRFRAGPAGLPGMARSFPSLSREHLLLGSQVDRLFASSGVRAPRVIWTEHHASHAAAAFLPSPFPHAAIVTVDGVGEWSTASIAHGRSHRVSIYEEMRFPDSVGLLYSAFTVYCGFRANSGEGELMGLAPYGEPRFVDAILDHLVDVLPDGSIKMDQRYFAYVAGRRTTSRRFHRLFGGDPRPQGAEPTQREADLAASVQVVTERIVLAMARHALAVTGERTLCLAGGVALNCVANGRLSRELDIDGLWVQPAAGDAGGAVGAALHTWHEVLGHPRPVVPGRRDAMSGAHLGPSFSTDEVRQFLDEEQVDYEWFADDDFAEVVARHLADGATVGWFSGRMEYGPRALGARSILADARRPGMQPRINRMVKERQSFRPFAPAVLAEHADEWFEDCGASPYMLLTAQVLPDRLVDVEVEPTGLDERTDVVRSEIPSATHVDGSARVQTVDVDSNPSFRRLLLAFADLTGCPLLLNTSFNGRAEPIVCTPADALATATRVGLDLLAIEGCLIDLRTGGPA